VDLLRCVLCEMNLPHDTTHPSGIPTTPCRPCMFGEHDYCHPIAPYWCSCDCGLKEDGDA